jgi:Fe-S cluster biogenesis protein NfuA
MDRTSTRDLLQAAELALKQEFGDEPAVYGIPISLVEVDQDRVLLVRLGDACQSCPATVSSLMQELERSIRAHVPEIRFVEILA